MTPTFHIVFTPGTVPYLAFFVSSLLDHSECHFRLVSNGCLAPERLMLQKLCAGSDRLTFLTVPTKGMADHGTILNYLQAINDEDRFCFLDSDLLATGDFMAELGPYLSDTCGLFSAGPVWTTFADGILPSEFGLMSGLHHHTDDGTCLGSTFFAAYDHQQLTEVIQSTGIGFQAYNWDELPVDIRRLLSSRGWEKRGYDTAKVLNLILQARGGQLRYVEADTLCHIGGFSFLPAQQGGASNWQHRIVDRLMDSPLRRVLAPLRSRWRSHVAYRDIEGLSEPERQAIIAQRVKQRDPVRRYFLQLLTSLVTDQTLPQQPTIGIPEIDAGVEHARERILDTYARSRTPAEIQSAA